MKSKLNGWQQTFTILLYASIATFLLIPIASNSKIPYMLDYFNHLSAIMQAKLALIEGQFPLRVAPTGNHGWRYPYFQFYSPLSYTIAGAIYQWVTPTQPFLAYKITLWCSIMLGGVYMNRLCYWFTQSLSIALLASIAYLTAPYYVITINHLGSFNETIALGLIPLVLYYTLQRFLFPSKNITLLQTSFVWFALATIHLITFIYLSIFVAILLLLITLKNQRHWLHLVNTGIAYGFGCTLAMWFLGPIIVLGKHLIVAKTFVPLAKSEMGTSLATLLSPLAHISAVTTQAISSNGTIDTLSLIHPNLGIAILLGASVSLYAIVRKSFSGNKRFDYWLPFLFITFIITFFATWSPIHFWKWLPTGLNITQYSWRLLGQTMWLGTLLFSWSVYWLYKNTLSTKHLLLGIVALLLLASSWFASPETKKISTDKIILPTSIIFNADAYLLNPYKNSSMITFIDHLTLPSTRQTKNNSAVIKLDALHSIAKHFTPTTSPTYMTLQGKITSRKNATPIALMVYLNHMLVGIYTVMPGHIQLDIPFAKIKKLVQNHGATLQLFAITNHPKEKLQLLIQEVALSGFLTPKTVITAKHTATLCHQEKTETICSVATHADTRIIELPLYYYPELFTIMLNGKIIPYFSVLYGNKMIIGITPIPGEVNHIQIQFHGLAWANTLSTLSWFIWGMFLIFILLRKLSTDPIYCLQQFPLTLSS
ncbi:MAG: hypothetical protein A3E83_05140 [Gammaproteobacteria bacterium RIFCSPHIGHO2_12_FULL_41_20]|nr:MAG: hypothetical protein A3E83_05140 [Gammaproteobacteria bacterium RIFCSPHIGHO2_12_FULL_41_20]